MAERLRSALYPRMYPPFLYVLLSDHPEAICINFHSASQQILSTTSASAYLLQVCVCAAKLAPAQWVLQQ